MLRKVYIPGVWDMLHVGHITILENAKRLGELLAVGVPSDDVVQLDKGRPPIIPVEDRVRMLSSLRCVDLVLIYDLLDFVTHLELLKPAVFVCGQMWGAEKRHKRAEEWCEQNRCSIVQLPYYQPESTTKIKKRVIAQGVIND